MCYSPLRYRPQTPVAKAVPNSGSVHRTLLETSPERASTRTYRAMHRRCSATSIATVPAQGKPVASQKVTMKMMMSPLPCPERRCRPAQSSYKWSKQVSSRDGREGALGRSLTRHPPDIRSAASNLHPNPRLTRSRHHRERCTEVATWQPRRRQLCRLAVLRMLVESYEGTRTSPAPRFPARACHMLPADPVVQSGHGRPHASRRGNEGRRRRLAGPQQHATQSPTKHRGRK